MPTAGLVIVCRDYPAGTSVGEHCHTAGQFIHAMSGVMEVCIGQRLWLVPPRRAVWVPPRWPHRLRAHGPVALRTLYLAPQSIPEALRETPSGHLVTPLLRELILRLAGTPQVEPTPRLARLQQVLLDELADLPRDELSLGVPRDPRLAKACTLLLAEPGAPFRLADLAQRVGAAPRTLARLAQAELGCPLSLWRQQLRVLWAIPRLVAGTAVAQVAQDLGYDTPSAFAALFKRLLGTTPTAFVHQYQGAQVPTGPASTRWLMATASSNVAQSGTPNRGTEPGSRSVGLRCAQSNLKGPGP